MTNGRRWLALDADMFGKRFTHDLHDRFGAAGVVVWVAFLCACKRSPHPGRIRIMNAHQAAHELGIAGWDLVDNKGEPWDLDDFFAFTGRKKQTRRRSTYRRDARGTATGQCFDIDATHWQRWQETYSKQRESERKRRSRAEKRPESVRHVPDTPRTNVRRDRDNDKDTPLPPNGGSDALRAKEPQDLRVAANAIKAILGKTATDEDAPT